MLFPDADNEFTLFVISPEEGGEAVVLLMLRPGQMSGQQARLGLPVFGGRPRGGQREDQLIRGLFNLTGPATEAEHQAPKLTDGIWASRALLTESGARVVIRLEELSLPAELLAPHLVDLDKFKEYSTRPTGATSVCGVHVSQLIRANDPVVLAALALYQSRPAPSPG